MGKLMYIPSRINLVKLSNFGNGDSSVYKNAKRFFYIHMMWYLKIVQESSKRFDLQCIELFILFIYIYGYWTYTEISFLA